MTKFYSPLACSRRATHRLARPLAALGLLLATAGAAQAQTFAPAVTYATGTVPQDIVTVDVNGDGRLDIITANSTANNVGVLLGSATTPGTFPATATFYGSGGNFPVGLGVGDVNGDGRPDIVVDNQSDNNVSVLLNSATTPGTFLAAVTYGSGSMAPRGLGLIDLNGDSRLDIVTGGATSNTIGVLLNLAATPGTFGTPLTYPTGVGADGIAVGDVNGDGRPDVAVTGYLTANTITMLLNSATSPGTFPTMVTYSSGGVKPRGVTLADVNGDGLADIVAGNETSNSVGVLLNQPATPGTFGTPALYTSGASGPDGVRVRDMNGDGRPDIVATNYNVSNGTTVSVLLNSATTLGTFATGTTYSSGGQGPVGLALGDLNSDGRPDIAATNVLSATVGVLLNTTLFAVPTLSSISPTSGPVGNSVTLTGTNLTGATGVSFNGTAATTFVVVNATTVTATVPTGATTGNVTVTTPSGTSNGVAFAVSPPTNNALAFDGVNDYVHSTGTLPATGEFTLEGWVNPTAYGGSFNAFVLSDNFPAGAMHSQFEGSNGYGMEFTVNGNSPTDVHTSLKPPLGQWSHVAVVYSASAKTVTFYLNGALYTSASYTTAVPVAALSYSLGGWLNGATPDRFFNGKYDEVRVYAAALTQARVQADMFSTASALPASQAAYYNFDQGIAGGTNAGVTTLNDQSGNSRTGTLTNFALTGTASNWVRSFPTITGITPTSGQISSSVSVSGTNLLDATGFKFNGTAVSPFTTPTNDFSATVTVPSGATTGPVSVSSATLTAYNGPTFTVAATTAVTWTGAVSTAWATAGNWSPAVVPTGSIDVTIPSAPANQPLVSGTQAAKDVTVQAGASLTLAATTAPTTQLTLGTTGTAGNFTLAAGSTFIQRAASEIYITGNMTNNGATFVLDATSEVGFGLPSFSHLLNGTAGVTFQILTVGEQGSFDNLTIQVPAQVRRKLGVYNNSTTNIGTGGSLTLLSDATGTALVENGAGSTVGGAVTVQRYIDPSLNAGPGYRHYSAPVANTTVADLATAGFSPEVSQAATYNASPTPSLVTPFPTVFGYDQSRVTLANTYAPFDRGFVVPAATSTSLAVGRGYAVNIGGTQLVDFVGTLNNGNVAVGLSRTAGNADAGWQLLGNPYPAPLDYSLVAPADRAGLDAAIYVYSSTAQYAGAYRAYVNGVGPGNPVLPVAQGFFARVSAGQTAATLTFRNAQRLTAPNATPFQRPATDPRPLVQLDLRGASGPADALYAYAEAGATPAYDAQYDAVKLPNSTGLNLSSTATSGEALAIDGRPAFAAVTVLPLVVGVPAAGTYSFTAVALNNIPAALDAFLSDAQTGQTVNLRLQPAYAFSVSPAQAAALVSGRFTLHFAARAALATAPALSAAQVALYPNPAHDRFTVLVPAGAGAAPVHATLLNALGQVVRTQAAASGTAFAVETGALAAGVYTLRLQVGATTLAKRVVLY